ncbi:MAG: methyltransferase, CheR-type, SAM-binding domain, C-terminal [Gemmatimonadetes bacterium]|nr:methyltransferase, CheR-type, SAM-binding domain, C-terminal [Gemmatimonadota bacterium]
MNEQDVEFEALTQKIARERGFGCASYKEKCLRRRIAVRMRARGVHRYSDYALLLDGDAVEYEKLLDALTINVTRLFRNWDVYEAVRTLVLPALWEMDAPELRVWSAGCSSGEEPYSLAVLMHRDAMERGISSRLARVRVLGTDIDRLSLAAAEKGEFEEGDFADTPAELRRDYFSAAPPFRVSDAPRRLVRFEQRDLLREEAPAGPHHLVVCRNVLIYFDRPTQERLFAKFHEALLPGGFLVLGKVETLLGGIRAKFAPVNARERIFRKL